MTDCVIRRLLPEDAPGVRELVHTVWGMNYSHHEVYEPEELLRLNREGRLISLVAVTASGTIIAHDALERPDLGVIAETGMAMAHPDYRSEGIISRTRAQLVEVAGQIGLEGVFGIPVTIHTHTQRIYESLGFHCTGVLPGHYPRTFVPVGLEPTSSPGRQSALLYFRFLRPQRARTVFAPVRHVKTIMSIYGRLGVSIEIPQSVPGLSMATNLQKTGPTASLWPEAGLLRLPVSQAGAVSPAWLKQWASEHTAVEVICIDLPLEDPACPLLCHALEESGFFFAALIPCALEGQDAIRFMRLRDKDFVRPYAIFSAEARDLWEKVLPGIR